MQTAAKIALVNLGNVSRSLQRAFNDTEMLAEKKLQSKNDAIDRIPSALEALGLVKVHPVFGKQEQTMTDFFDKTELSDAMEMCRKTNEDVEQRIKELKATMEEFIHQGEGLKQEVLAWEPQVVQDSGQVREIGLIADKIERGKLFEIVLMRLPSHLGHDESTYCNVSVESFVPKSYTRVHPQHLERGHLTHTKP